MKFPTPLIEGTLLRRHRRFLAEVRLEDGQEVTAHCPNTGSLLGIATPGNRVWLSRSNNPRRRLRFTWELVEDELGALVCVNTNLANRLAEEAIENGLPESLQGCPEIRREVPYGRENSRIDLLLEGPAGRCWVEVKSVTLARQGIAGFPDAVTLRGQKHLRELTRLARNGERAVLLFCIQRSDVHAFAPAADIDPEYARLLAAALRAGVECLAYKAAVSLTEIRLAQEVPVRLDAGADDDPPSAVS